MADGGEGCYVYCVVPADDRPTLEGLRAVDGRHPLEVVNDDGLAAVVSSVPLEEFGEEALRRNFEDMDWLERTARAHQDVLGGVLERSPALVPMRLCTIFADADHVREMLEREGPVLADALERVRDRSEWGVKVLADRAAVEAAARARAGDQAPEEGAGGAGRAYLARKRVERSLQERSREMVDAAIEEIHTRLRTEADAATLLPPQRRELSGRTGEMVLNGAYLVHRARVGGFTAAVEELRERHRDLGLEIELGGPWAPYNFVDVRQAA